MSNKEYILDFIFIRYFFVVYYLYIMSVNVIFPKNGIWSILVNGLMVLFLIYISFVRSRYNNKFSFIYLYAIFIFLLIVLQSSNFLYSIEVFIKYMAGLLCLPIGFNVLSSVKRMKEFQKTGIILLLLYIVNIVLANVFHLGDYYGYKVEGGMEIGNVFSDGLYINVYVITSIFFILLLFPSKKKFILLLSSICAILVVVNMKRTVIFQLFVGIVVYQFFFYIYNRRKKSKFGLMQLRYLGLLLLLAMLILPLFYNEIQLKYESREGKFEKAKNDIATEGRIAEFIYINDEILNSDKVLTMLFGKETFNLVGTYANGIFGSRQIHGDYSKLLHGMGIIGCLFWFFIHLYLILWIIKMQRKSYYKGGILSRILYSLYFTLILLYCIAMGSGTFGLVLSPSFVYSLLGGILRHFYNKEQITYMNNMKQLKRY